MRVRLHGGPKHFFQDPGSSREIDRDGEQLASASHFLSSRQDEQLPAAQAFCLELLQACRFAHLLSPCGECRAHMCSPPGPGDEGPHASHLDSMYRSLETESLFLCRSSSGHVQSTDKWLASLYPNAKPLTASQARCHTSASIGDSRSGRLCPPPCSCFLQGPTAHQKIAGRCRTVDIACGAALPWQHPLPARCQKSTRPGQHPARCQKAQSTRLQQASLAQGARLQQAFQVRQDPGAWPRQCGIHTKAILKISDWVARNDIGAYGPVGSGGTAALQQATSSGTSLPECPKTKREPGLESWRRRPVLRRETSLQKSQQLATQCCEDSVREERRELPSSFRLGNLSSLSLSLPLRGPRRRLGKDQSCPHGEAPGGRASAFRRERSANTPKRGCPRAVPPSRRAARVSPPQNSRALQLQSRACEVCKGINHP